MSGYALQWIFLTLQTVIFIVIAIPAPNGVNSLAEIVIPEEVAHDLL